MSDRANKDPLSDGGPSLGGANRQGPSSSPGREKYNTVFITQSLLRERRRHQALVGVAVIVAFICLGLCVGSVERPAPPPTPTSAAPAATAPAAGGQP